MIQRALFTTTQKTSYPISLLIKNEAFVYENLEQYYVNHLNREEVIAFSLPYNEAGKCPVSFIKKQLNNLLKMINHIESKYILCADSNYFKVLTNSRKAEPHYGAVLDCAIKGYEHIKVILSMNYKALFHNPAFKDKLDLSIKTINTFINGSHQEIGKDIIHYADYPNTIEDIKESLNMLLTYPALTVDIETFSLIFNKAKLGSIAFAWNKHEGISFQIDNDPINSNKELRVALKEFFTIYKGTLIYHNASFDIKILIYELFMDSLLDTKGLINGLNTMYRNIHDTKIIAYLATNTCAGNTLSLKQLAFEFAGNYAIEEINDITQVPYNDLLTYNLIDCLSTWYVYDKYYSIMVNDNQLDIYNNIMIPSLKVITQMELVGIPINMDQILTTKSELSKLLKENEDIINNSTIINDFITQYREEVRDIANSKLKKKVKPIEDFMHITFNPNSPNQVAKLLYDFIGLPVLDKTDTGLPATGNDTLKKLKQYLLNKGK